MNKISFETTKDEDGLIEKITERAAKIYQDRGQGHLDQFSLMMDLEATNANGCKIDFQKLIEADDFNFVHDVFGIIRNINRTNGKLENCFLPRSAK